jgi:type IV secretory pathway VirD2 relaxase
MSNDDPVFLSTFIEYLDNSFLSRKVKIIIIWRQHKENKEIIRRKESVNHKEDTIYE